VSSCNSDSNTLEPDRPQHDRPDAYAIEQQFSSAPFLSLSFHFRNKKLETLSKILFYFFIFLKIA
jgi:hypothetical protein